MRTRPAFPSTDLFRYRAAARNLLPILALAVAGCASEDAPSGPSAIPPDLASATLPSFVQVTAGDEHTCAVTTAGLIYCWGSNQRKAVKSGGQSAPGITPARPARTWATRASGANGVWM